MAAGPTGGRGSAEAPPAQGVRLGWMEVPQRVRDAVAHWLGSTVESAVSQPTGFSPGVAARLRTADGRRVFAKAISGVPSPDAPAIHRREASIARALPVAATVPRLLWSYDEGDAGWVVLVFEDVAGRHPAQPWHVAELDRVLKGLAELAIVLTPSPLPSTIVGTASDIFEQRFCGWRRLRDERPSQPAPLDDWSARHLEELAALETIAEAAVAGDTLLHLDVRADNILLTRDRIWFVDWPLACVGDPWVDVLFFAPSVTMQGGPPPEQIVARYPASRTADPEAITAVVAAIAGFFTYAALQPPPPGLPTVRAFQAAQGVVARDWIAQRTGWR